MPNLRFFLTVIWTALALTVGAYLDWETHQIVLLCLIVWQIMYPARLSYLITATIACLLVVPVLTVLHKDIRADEVALAAYTGFALCVLTALLQYFEQRLLTKKGDDVTA